MRLLFVVQRYGPEVAGGAEQHCRQFATRLAAAGHEVEVLTSRALSSATWDNHYRPETAALDGVTVHRLDSPGPRDDEYFEALSWRVLWSGPGARVPPVLAESWVRAQGPFLVDLIRWINERASSFDAAIFFTYLYYPTWAGIRAAAGRLPTVLHATAHDEPAFWLPVFDTPLRSPDMYAWSTEEERDLLRRRGVASVPGALIGVGVDLDPTAGAEESGFRRAWQLDDRRYLLALGRVAEAKGSTDLAAWFGEYKNRFPGDLALVLAGEADTAVAAHPDIRVTGYLSDKERLNALAGATALVQPSYHESFSMVVAEAWAAGKPVLVQGRSTVLAGQALRSGGALIFRGLAELEASIELLMSDPGLGSRLGESGRRYVADRYSWPAVIARYEDLLCSAVERFARRAVPRLTEADEPVLDPPSGH